MIPLSRLPLLVTIWLSFMIIGCLLSVFSSNRASSRADKHDELAGGEIIHYSPDIAVQAILIQLVIISVSQMRHDGIRPESIAIAIMTMISLIIVIIAIKVAWFSYVKYTTTSFDESWGIPSWAFIIVAMIVIDLTVFINLPIIIPIVLYIIPTVILVIIGNWDLINRPGTR